MLHLRLLPHSKRSSTTTTTATGTEAYPNLGKRPSRKATRQRVLRPRTLRFRYARGVSSSPLQPGTSAILPALRCQSVAPAPCEYTKRHGRRRGVNWTGYLPYASFRSPSTSSSPLSITSGVYRYRHVRMLGKALPRRDPFKACWG